MKNTPLCRLCETPLKHIFADLGKTPLANSNLRNDAEIKEESAYPLCAYVCASCFLVQLPEVTTRENIFEEYSYFSSFSHGWLNASKEYVESTLRRFGYGGHSLVLEVGSNDGYLLQYFQAKGVPVLGIEPAQNVARAAVEKGIPTRSVFFGVSTAKALIEDEIQADHIVIKNVMAHVPDLHDFVGGLSLALKPDGTLSVEFPHLYTLMQYNQFDTIYHEHFCYFSFLVVEKLFQEHGLSVFDVEELPTHGGSLRVWACHGNQPRPETKNVSRMRQLEERAKLKEIETYTSFGESVLKVKRALRTLLEEEKNKGKTIAAYGAPAKGNTLLNFCGIGTTLIDYTVDRNPYKQGRFLPGTHIPIHSPEKIKQTKPDYVLILPWNLKEEIMSQMSEIKNWGGKFIIPIPHPEIVSHIPYEISGNAA